MVLGLTDTVNVYVVKSSDNDNLTLSALKSRFVFSSIVKVSRFVDDHALSLLSVGCHILQVNCAKTLNALELKLGTITEILDFGMDNLTHDRMACFCCDVER
jgi:hypothetical protein